MIFEANKNVNDPFDESLTVFDRAKATQPDKDYPDTPRIGGLGSGSDFTSFYQFLGIPSIHMMYRSNVLVSVIFMCTWHHLPNMSLTKENNLLSFLC